jgi:uncharacterized protein YcfL
MAHYRVVMPTSPCFDTGGHMTQSPHILTHRFTATAAGLIAVLLLSACSTPSINDMVSRAGNTKNIQIQDMRSVTRNGLLTAQVSVRNESDSNTVGYRFKWLSKSGVAVWDEESWKPITLGTGQTANLIGIAPTPDATDFRFELGQYR